MKPSDPNPENTILVGMSADQAIVRYGNITLRDAMPRRVSGAGLSDCRAGLDEQRAVSD